MYDYNNILVPLNLTTMDDAVIEYASEVCKLFKAENVHFLHVKRPSDIPKEIIEEYPQLLNPGKEERMETMKSRVSKAFKESTSTDVMYEIIEGKPFEVILEQVVKKNIDLVIVGRKTDARETRRLPINLTRKVPCSVLVVPEKSNYSISSILVSVDFSDFCKNALELAIDLAKANNMSLVHCLHVFRLPIGYSKTGKTEEEFTEIMKKNALRAFNLFISKLEVTNIEVSPIFMLDDKPEHAIQTTVEENKVDIVVLGTRGRSAGSGLLLGSVTESIILNTKVPLIAVKKKGTGLSLLKVILKYL